MPAVQNYDVVVIGAGGAGLLPQLKLRAKALTLFLLKNADRRRKLSDFRR